MRTNAVATFLTLASCAYGQSSPFGEPKHDALIARMRVAALQYAEELQDFLCTQLTTRTVDQSGSGKRWKLLETQELEVGYIAHKEHYRLVKVNGKTAELEGGVKKGYFAPSGEFGTALLWIFDPKAAAEFQWDHEESSAGKRSCVFHYRVPVTTTTLVMVADADRVRMGHHGFVTADCDSAMVIRTQTETDPASVNRQGREMAIGKRLDVRYGLTTIASKTFLLPQQAIEVAPFGRLLTRVEIRFQNYRKYDSSSNITFDDGTIKPDNSQQVVK
jgi:hypothetical protein